MREVIIGSRDSVLAVAQTKIVMDYINRKCENVSAAMLTMKTTGDKILDRTLDKIGGKGLFVKELDRALLDGNSELSVHSLKDLPVDIDDRLPILGYLEAESASDVLVLPKDCNEIDFSLPIGTSSNRRARQFLELYPNADIKPVRGNVLTRLRKLDDGEYGAIILAKAGLKRLGLENRINREFTVDEMVPAAGQGVIAVQGRSDLNYDYLKPLFSEETEKRIQCEREFISRLDGGCSEPIAAHAVINGDEITLWGYYYNENTGIGVRRKVVGLLDDGVSMAADLADKMKGLTK